MEDPDFEQGDVSPIIKLEDAIKEMADNFDIKQAKFLIQNKIKEMKKASIVKLSIRG
jgi:hypothetical protein